MSDDATRSAPDGPSESAADPERSETREPRPFLERVGLAAISLVLAVMFGGVSAASWIGGEPFLAVMGGVGCLMTLWVGAVTLLRG